MTVAALYIDPRGPYPKLLRPELCWDEARDARTYAGPWPVVAHPACGPWSKSRHLYRGAEHDHALRAVDQVRQFGGVLEHPADSLLWAAGLELPRPGEGDRFGGFTVEVVQCEWGHVARKRTWVYCVRVPSILDGHSVATLPPPPFPGRAPTHWASGRRGMARAIDNVPPGIKVCSAQQRRRTPPLFAAWLISLAEQAGARKAAE